MATNLGESAEEVAGIEGRTARNSDQPVPGHSREHFYQCTLPTATWTYLEERERVRPSRGGGSDCDTDMEIDLGERERMK